MSKSTAPGFNTHAMLPPVELFVWVPSGMIRGYLKVLQDRQRCKGPGIRGGFTRSVAASPWHSQCPNLPPPPALKPARAPRPSPQPRHIRGSTGGLASQGSRPQTSRLLALLLGPGVRQSLIHSFVHPTDA